MSRPFRSARGGPRPAEPRRAGRTGSVPRRPAGCASLPAGAGPPAANAVNSAPVRPPSQARACRSARYIRRGGCGRAPDSYHVGTRRSREIARRAAARPAASSSRVEEMNTRTRWSGVKITSVRAITSQASPAAACHEDHLRQAGDPRTSAATSGRKTAQPPTDLLAHAPRRQPPAQGRAATPARRDPRAGTGATDQPVPAQRASPAPGGCRPAERRIARGAVTSAAVACCGD